jgi:hypothetical protein
VLDIWHIVYDAIRPHFPDTPLANQIDSWYAFQEFFGLRPSTLKKDSKSAQTFFVCCFCDDAWDVLLQAASKAGPINIHGCLAKITEFPPENKKQQIIVRMNQHAKDFQDLHAVHTDRLRILDQSDEQTLLLLTPNLKALAPRYVDHLPSPVCHTMFFLPDPTTVSLHSHNIHKANIPPLYLAPAPRTSYLRAGTIIASETPSPRKKNVFDDSNLQDIFSQWNTATPPDHPHRSSPAQPFLTQPTQKRSRSTAQPQEIGRTLFHTQQTGEPPSAPQRHPPPTTTNFYAALDISDDDDEDSNNIGLGDDEEWVVEQQQTTESSTHDDSLGINDDDSATIVPASTLEDMSTSSTDSSYRPPSADLSDDDLSADESADLGQIYLPDVVPSPLLFNIHEFETALSQQAFLHFQQIQQQASLQLPTQQPAFNVLLEEAVRTNQDPVILEDTVHRWMSHQP